MISHGLRKPLLAAALLAAAVLFWLAPFRSATESAARAQGKATNAPPGGEEAIRKAARDYVAAMIKGDINEVMTFWDDDADYVDETGKVTRGREALTELFKAALPNLKGAKITGTMNSLKFIRPEIALEDGTLTMTEADGTVESNRYAIVWSKSGDRWVISSARDLPTEVTELPSAAFPQLRQLEWLLGEWQDASDKVDVQVKCHWAENKAFLLVDYVVKREGEAPLSVSQRIGWDPYNVLLRSWVFDSNGGFGEGYWHREGNKWIVDAAGILPDGGTGGATYTYEFVDENAFTWRSTDREVDGQPVADAEVKFVRKGAKQ